MNKLSTDARAKIIGCLVEGCSMRSTTRLTGAAKKTVERLLVSIGTACAAYQDEVMRDLPCVRVQCDEIWAYCYAKDANLPDDKMDKPGFGSIWTWTAICADTKLIPCWFVGTRDAGAAYEFMHDLKNRLKYRVQLATDGHKAYLSAIEDAFGSEVDYAMTNAFSKKYENHCHAVALHFMHYNFCRIHQSLRCTPAMEAQITDHVWSLEEVAALLN